MGKAKLRCVCASRGPQQFDATAVDLSGFGVSPTVATDVKVELKDPMLSVHVSEVLAFRQNLSRLPGRSVGARWT